MKSAHSFCKGWLFFIINNRSSVVMLWWYFLLATRYLSWQILYKHLNIYTKQILSDHKSICWLLCCSLLSGLCWLNWQALSQACWLQPGSGLVYLCAWSWLEFSLHGCVMGSTCTTLRAPERSEGLSCKGREILAKVWVYTVRSINKMCAVLVVFLSA